MGGSATVSAIFAQRVVVGVGDMAVSNNVEVILSTFALGSCIGVVAYDPVMRSGGILHLMLPASSISPEKAMKQPAMFADTGFPLLFSAMAGIRAERPRIRLLVTGGASVLGGVDPFKIGQRNADAIFALVARDGLRVVHRDTGGTVNRTVHLELKTGTVIIKSPVQTTQHSLAS